MSPIMVMGGIIAIKRESVWDARAYRFPSGSRIFHAANRTVTTLIGGMKQEQADAERQALEITFGEGPYYIEIPSKINAWQTTSPHTK